MPLSKAWGCAPDAQLYAIERVSAAVCGYSLPDMRARIAKHLAGKPSGAHSTSGGGSSRLWALAHILSATKADPPAAQGHTTHKTEVLTVEHALVAEGLLAEQQADGSFGTKTVSATRTRPADGIPRCNPLVASS